MDTSTPPIETPSMLQNLIRIDNPDTPIYRVFAREPPLRYAKGAETLARESKPLG